MFAKRDALLKAVLTLLEIAAAVILLLLMLLTCVDVIGRYFFNRPVWGGFEMTEAMLAVLIFVGLPLVTLRGDHIEIDMLPIPAALTRVHHWAVHLLGVTAAAFLAYRLWLRANQLYASGETTLQLGIKVAYVGYIMSVFMTLTAVAFLIVAILPPRPRSALVSEI